MGYELHITRADNWAENQDDDIGAEEWLRLIEMDEELSLNTDNGPYFAMWSGHSRYGEPWFDWSDGNIHAKYPDKFMLGKMLEIADKLGAKVQGDDGETYTSVDQLPDPVPIDESHTNKQTRMPAFMRRELMWNLVTYGTIVIVILGVYLLDLW